ncbi:MAG TPA: M20/M25/M40 family metallo-hydrolase [Thermoanaerobaculia bacterium]|nr:M20/M25/M40 family metallo-hydrolase [Thermoanaerobaculia bacterium]
MTAKRSLVPALLVILAACRTATPPPTANPRIDAMRTFLGRDDLTRAFAAVTADHDATIAQWRMLTEIPAPSGHEQKRADAVEALLREYGLTDVHRDAAGNVMGTRKGTGGGHHVVLDAHLDTVFALDTNVKTRMENGKLYAPGIGDDTRNVAALLAAIRAMNAANLQTKGDLTFVFTVEEETNFRGVNQFLEDHKGAIDRYLTFDGGYENFTYGGIGIYWHRYHILGPGGHTRSSNPPYSATLPLARAIDRIYKLKVPSNAWINVGMLRGSDVFNAKAADAWMSMDLRSNDEPTLKRLDAEIQRIVQEEAKRAGMTMRRDVDSTEEVASLPGHRNSEMVQTVEAIYRAMGFNPAITDTASNHTSAALRAGIPAVGMGMAPCEGSHGLDENCEIEPIFNGIQRTIVLAAALSD